MVYLDREERYKTLTYLYGGRYEEVDRYKVYHKSGWRCYLCNERVKATRKPVDNQATLDHVIALANGGDHSYKNVKCCCRKCNLAKGSRKD